VLDHTMVTTLERFILVDYASTVIAKFERCA
jgi:hypothetical protein